MHEPKPRFLARTGRHGTFKKLPPTSPTDLGRWAYVEDTNERDDDLGYTNGPARALPVEPECIGPAILDGYAESNAYRFAQQHAIDVALMQQARPLLEAEDRIKDIRRRARFAHVDLSHETHIMERDLARARAGNRKPPARVLERLEKVEGLLDGIAA